MNFQELPHWKGDGRNHVIIDGSIYQVNDASKERPLKRSENNLNMTGKAMIVSADNFLGNFLPRLEFDIIVPKFRYLDKPTELWKMLPPLLPVRRKYLFSYKEPKLLENKAIKNIIKETLKTINNDKTSDEVVINFNCKPEIGKFFSWKLRFLLKISKSFHRHPRIDEY